MHEIVTSRWRQAIDSMLLNFKHIIHIDDFPLNGHPPSLYYYRRAVRKNLSSKFDEFLAVRPQFGGDHGVDFYAHTCCQSATFGPLFAFCCPLFFAI